MNQFTLLLNSALKQTRCWSHSNSQLKFILIIVSWASSRKRPSLNIVVACCKNHPRNRPAPVTGTFFASPGFPLTRASFDCIFLQIYIGSLNFEPKWKYIRSRVTTDGRKISRQWSTKPLSSQMGSGFNNYVNVYLLNSQNRLHLKRRVRFSMKCFGIYVYQGRAKRVVGSPVTTKTKTR